MRNPTSGSDAGFSLIEVLVALGVFSIAVIGLLDLNTQALRSRTQLEEAFEARTLAENILVEGQVMPEAREQASASGERAQGLRRYAWTRIVVPTDREGLVRVRVEVRDADGRLQASLETLRGEP